ncbi:hypothetical protein ACQ4PT_017300 [Festuca glaucescens]
MASDSDDLGEAGVGPETLRVHDWVPEGIELRFAFLMNIRRDRYIVDAKKKKKFQGGFDYPLPMDCNWSFRQFGEVICSLYPWGLHDEVEFRYYDGETEWVKVSNDAELATMFAKHKEKGQFHVRLQNDVVVPALGPSRAESCYRNGSSSQNSSVGGPSVSARRRGGSTSVGTGSRVPREVEPDYVDDEERLYSDVVQNLRRACRAENQDEADIDASVIDDEEGEDKDLPPVQWDPENPQMEEGSIFASMSECRNALVTYYIKAERTFEVDKSDTVCYRMHCPTDNCPWRMHVSKMRNSMNIQVKVNPFRHTCLESTLRKETISRVKSRWVAEEVKRWVTENHQVGTKEFQKNLKEKFKIELPYMRVFNGKQRAMESIYGNIQQYVHEYYSVARFKATYVHALPALEGKQQWDIVDPGFKLCAPVLKRPAVDPAFGECFDDENDAQQPVAPDDENDAHQPHDFANDPNDDSDDDQIEAPNDDQIDYQSDQNVEQNDAPIEAPNDGDQNVEQNDAPIEAPKDGDQNVKKNYAPTEAPNDAWFKQSGGSEL